MYEPKSPAEHYRIAERVTQEVIESMSRVTLDDGLSEEDRHDAWMAIHASIGLGSLHAMLADVSDETFQKVRLNHRTG
jgi:hypothetical protein